MPERVTVETIATLERLGLGAGLNYVARLFNGHGQNKHGDDGWRERSTFQLAVKAWGHIRDVLANKTVDRGSGMHPMAHVAGRALMFCTKWSEARRKAAAPKAR